MKLKYILVSITLIILTLSKLNAQEDIVNWTFEIEDIDNKKTLKAIADIKEGWFIYSQHTDDGPIPTAFEINRDTSDAEAIVFTEKSTPIKNYSELFEAEVIKFKDEAIFTISIDDYNPGDNISGSVIFMSCDKSKCLPPRSVDFEVKI